MRTMRLDDSSYCDCSDDCQISGNCEKVDNAADDVCFSAGNNIQEYGNG